MANINYTRAFLQLFPQFAISGIHWLVHGYLSASGQLFGNGQAGLLDTLICSGPPDSCIVVLWYSHGLFQTQIVMILNPQTDHSRLIMLVISPDFLWIGATDVMFCCMLH
ncbi:hypothetical protein N7495_003421 [Penicillium taxi]|uniref:uncharacterized protein n=1 Tax=Penicillium taxi TaxID=168475 RepID=UPI002544D62A|nr:uncharacterized protein N7495_003421 [Penicillium taxi]KAJ5902893.1 hypothetical protein N7495_003421 [Penicillium taxi]